MLLITVDKEPQRVILLAYVINKLSVRCFSKRFENKLYFFVYHLGAFQHLVLICPLMACFRTTYTLEQHRMLLSMQRKSVQLLGNRT